MGRTGNSSKRSRVAQGQQKGTETTENTTHQQEVASMETTVGAQVGGRQRRNKKVKGGLTSDGVAFDGM
jgi:hypothetical protein